MISGWNRWLVVAGFIVFGGLTVACSSPVPAISPSPAQPALENQGQSLPISAEFRVANQTIQLEIAKTPEQQATGLMYRSSLAADRGMLFPFQPARQVGFWMKNVTINLDMVFLYQGKVKAIASNVPPCTSDPCPIYGPSGLIDQVIELRGGRAAELGIRVGDPVSIRYF